MRLSSPPETTFGYDAASGAHINQLSVVDPAQFAQDTYQWCLDHGLVVEDQR